jgi:hypothetical protein
MPSLPDFPTLAARFDAPGVKAIVLMGSFARGDAGPFSDIDLVRFTALESAAPASHIIDSRLVTVSTFTLSQAEDCFSDPHQAVEYLAGLRTGQALIDRGGYFAALQTRAQAFSWDSDMQLKANQYASREMVGWIEEVHKGLEGLQRSDPGRMLNARFGLTWGLAGLLLVQRGVLKKSDNSFFDQILAEMGESSEWSCLLRAAYGITPLRGRANTLPEQVRAGLRLYALTARLLEAALQPGDLEMVRETVARIESNIE